MINLFLDYTDAHYNEMVKIWEGTPEAFEVKWMIGRIAHWCKCISLALSNNLNECGWLFKEDDGYCKMYDTYQGLERLERLICYMTDKIDKEKNINEKDLGYCWGLSHKFSILDKHWDFISEQDQESMGKIYRKYLKKFEEYAIRERNNSQVL